MTNAYCPQRGDVVWLSFNPRTGHEQAGHRPALTLSQREYNRKVGLALFCPIVSLAKGYPFEVAVPSNFPLAGVILSDQVKSMDWRARRASFCCRLPSVTLQEVTAKLLALIE